ncbi:MAG: hypothetical protein LBT91_01910 [Bifidobacteriaceae bacterium]|jgi:hypothetical protein|nr:hypothetical protein [Bifidobacteriaceae bacterium]
MGHISKAIISNKFNSGAFIPKIFIFAATVCLGLATGGIISIQAATSATILPISRGGTGVNSFPLGQALIAKNGSLQTLPIDTYPNSSSQNLLTSGGAYTYFLPTSPTMRTVLTSEPTFGFYGNLAYKDSGLVYINSPISVLQAVEANTTYKAAKFNSGYTPPPYSSIACNNNFFNSSSNILNGRIDCFVDEQGYLYMQASEASNHSSRYFNIVTVYKPID